MPLALRLPNSLETFECLVVLLCSPSKLSSVPELYSSDPKPWRGVAAPPPWPATKVAEAAIAEEIDRDSTASSTAAVHRQLQTVG